jgi:hypothetical protein
VFKFFVDLATNNENNIPNLIPKFHLNPLRNETTKVAIDIHTYIQTYRQTDKLLTNQDNFRMVIRKLKINNNKIYVSRHDQVNDVTMTHNQARPLPTTRPRQYDSHPVTHKCTLKPVSSCYYWYSHYYDLYTLGLSYTLRMLICLGL